MENKLSAIDFRFFIGCHCHVKDDSGFSIIEGINTLTNMVVISKHSRGYTYGYDPSLVKPILRRFETLSRHEVEQLNQLWPNAKINRTAFGSIQLDAKIINYLTLLNVDVFGWIDEGLAIDAAYNTITN